MNIRQEETEAGVHRSACTESSGVILQKDRPGDAPSSEVSDLGAHVLPATLEAQRQFFTKSWSPQRPLCGMGKGPTYRRSRELALTYRYVEANPRARHSLIVIDEDNGEADRIAGRLGFLDPSFITVNPWTRRGHIGYVLNTPVAMTGRARLAPQRLLRRVGIGVRTLLDGDPAYVGRIMKNPVFDPRNTIWGGERFGLTEIALALAELDALPTLMPGDAGGHEDHGFIGRNDSLFQLLRHWAYRERRRYVDRPYEVWEGVVFAHASEVNRVVIGSEYCMEPLVDNEVRTIARSVAKWVEKRITVAGFSELQRARGSKATNQAVAARRSAEARAHRADVLATKIAKFNL